MSASMIDRQRVRQAEHYVEAQCETEQLDTLLDAMVTQLRTQAATLAVVRTLSKRHRQTLRVAAGATENAA